MTEFDRKEALEAVGLIVQAEVDDDRNMYKGQGHTWMRWIVDKLYKYGFIIKEKE